MQTDEFLLNLGAKEIGDIKRVDIGFASKQSAGGAMGSLVGIGWCLQSCEVFHTNTQRRFFFPHGDWLNKSKKRVVLEEGHPGMQVPTLPCPLYRIREVHLASAWQK